MVYVPQDYRVIQEIQLKFDDEVVQLLNQMEQYDTDDSNSYEEMLSLEYQRLQEESISKLYHQLEEGVAFSQLMEDTKPGSSNTFNYVCEDTTRHSPLGGQPGGRGDPAGRGVRPAGAAAAGGGPESDLDRSPEPVAAGDSGGDF